MIHDEQNFQQQSSQIQADDVDARLSKTAAVVVVLMGVCGCGKTTIGKLLAKHHGFAFADGDDFHPVSNRNKMEEGNPLTDDDRFPWLKNLTNQMKTWLEADINGVIACSSLKKKYREILSSAIKENVVFVHLQASQEVILERVKARRQHFMPTTLVQSQFEILEPPDPTNEACLSVSASLSTESIVGQVIEFVRERKGNTSKK